MKLIIVLLAVNLIYALNPIIEKKKKEKFSFFKKVIESPKKSNITEESKVNDSKIIYNDPLNDPIRIGLKKKFEEENAKLFPCT